MKKERKKIKKRRGSERERKKRSGKTQHKKKEKKGSVFLSFVDSFCRNRVAHRSSRCDRPHTHALGLGARRRQRQLRPRLQSRLGIVVAGIDAVGPRRRRRCRHRHCRLHSHANARLLRRSLQLRQPEETTIETATPPFLLQRLKAGSKRTQRSSPCLFSLA